jgi:hypothetical protein
MLLRGATVGWRMHLIEEYYVQAAVACVHYVVFILMTFTEHELDGTLVQRNKLRTGNT